MKKLWYEIALIVFIIGLQSQAALEIDDRCSKFQSFVPKQHLYDCPPAKFAQENENENLLECYDNITKHAYGKFYSHIPSFRFLKVVAEVAKVSFVKFFDRKIYCCSPKGQIISECPLEILDFPKIPRKI